MIHLYTAATPNGWKASVLLEELGLAYETHAIDLMQAEQKHDWFLKMNPNGRIPVIVDDETEMTIFESGAIMTYLADKAGRLLPQEPKARYEVLQWVWFQVGGVGPMMGQANVFYRYFPEKIQPAIDRFQAEARRLLGVLDQRLSTREYLAGDYSIADIANWCWACIYKWGGIEADDYVHLKRWIEAIDARPAVRRGIAVPTGENAALFKSGDAEAADKFAKAASRLVERRDQSDAS
ncbi:MAG: glutathione S-transferase N-terminal domain-containing protein [Pseudomonadota bacterium]